MYFIYLLLVLLGMIIGILLTSFVCIITLIYQKQIRKILEKGEKMICKQERGVIFEPKEESKIKSILFGKQ